MDISRENSKIMKNMSEIAKKGLFVFWEIFNVGSGFSKSQILNPASL